MSTDAIAPSLPPKPAQPPSRKARRDYYAMARNQAKRTGQYLAPWGLTRLCLPNPRAGQVVDHIGTDDKPVMRSCIFGGNVDGTQLQRAQARRGNERLLPA